MTTSKNINVEIKPISNKLSKDLIQTIKMLEWVKNALHTAAGIPMNTVHDESKKSCN